MTHCWVISRSGAAVDIPPAGCRLVDAPPPYLGQRRCRSPQSPPLFVSRFYLFPESCAHCWVISRGGADVDIPPLRGVVWLTPPTLILAEDVVVLPIPLRGVVLLTPPPYLG